MSWISTGTSSKGRRPMHPFLLVFVSNQEDWFGAGRAGCSTASAVPTGFAVVQNVWCLT